MAHSVDFEAVALGKPAGFGQDGIQQLLPAGTVVQVNQAARVSGGTEGTRGTDGTGRVTPTEYPAAWL
jgi:hypothetical protein